MAERHCSNSDGTWLSRKGSRGHSFDDGGSFRSNQAYDAVLGSSHRYRSEDQGEVPFRRGRGKFCYTKRELTQVYNQMETSGQLVAPNECDIPLTLHRRGVMVGIHEFTEDKWVCVDQNGGVSGPWRKEEVLARNRNGDLPGNIGVVPLVWLKEKSVPLSQLMKMWDEMDKMQKENKAEVDHSNRVEGNNAYEIQEVLAERQEPVAKKEDPIVPPPFHRAKFDGVNLVSPEMDTDNFVYVDANGNRQGPFPKDQLLSWWRQGYLPNDLKLKPDGAIQDDFFLLPNLLAKWFSHEELWRYLDTSGTLQGPFPKDTIINWFKGGALPEDLKLQPEEWGESSTVWLELPQVLVFWLPQSSQWLCKRYEAEIPQAVTPEGALRCWKRDHNFDANCLKVKPQAWNGDTFFLVEKLLRAYGYLL